MTGLRGYDAWLLRGSDDYPDILLPGDEGWPHCPDCGGFLRGKVTFTTWDVQYEHCIGRPPYTGMAAAGLLHVAACWECRMMLPYAHWWDPACGVTRPHPPHIIEGWATQLDWRLCRKCGKFSFVVT